jgi:hypothetical protein
MSFSKEVEKLETGVFVRCTVSEKTNWYAAFPCRKVSATVRRLLNAAAAKKLKRKSA